VVSHNKQHKTKKQTHLFIGAYKQDGSYKYTRHRKRIANCLLAFYRQMYWQNKTRSSSLVQG